MKKRFNVTGVCFPTEHYMADSSAKYARILEMVSKGIILPSIGQGSMEKLLPCFK